MRVDRNSEGGAMGEERLSNESCVIVGVQKGLTAVEKQSGVRVDAKGVPGETALQVLTFSTSFLGQVYLRKC